MVLSLTCLLNQYIEQEVVSFQKIDVKHLTIFADKTSVSPEAIITDYICYTCGFMWAGHNWSSAQTKAYWKLALQTCLC